MKTRRAMFEEHEQAELHALAEALTEARLHLADVVRELLASHPELLRRLPGLDAAELVELAEVLRLAGARQRPSARLHAAVERVLAAQEAADNERARLAALAAEARYEQRVRVTLGALAKGKTSAWVDHLDRMSRDARPPL